MVNRTFASEIMVGGGVYDWRSNPIGNARLELKNAKLYTHSNERGEYDFTNAKTVKVLIDNIGRYYGWKKEISGKKQRPELYTLQGKKIDVTNRMKASTGLYIFRMHENSGAILQLYHYKRGNEAALENKTDKKEILVKRKKVDKLTAVIDTLIISKEGYKTVYEPIESYDAWKIITLKTTVPQSMIPSGMKYISEGSFSMGSTNGDPDETPVRQILITGFFIDSAEVTQGEYYSILGVKPWDSYDQGNRSDKGPNFPAWGVNWFDAVVYCNAKSKKENKDTVYTYTRIIGTPGDSCVLESIAIDTTKNGYRLPSEAQWEYACRAGTTSRFFWGDDESVTGQYAWYGENSNNATHQVGQKKPNAFGLYDMIGNAEEWVNDWHTDYNTEQTMNPTGGNSGLERVRRGATYVSPQGQLRSANRAHEFPDRRSKYEGFRTVIPYKK